MAEEVAKAYIQLIPSASGIKSAITKELGGDADEAGALAGGQFSKSFSGAVANIGKIALASVAAGAAAAGKLAKDAIAGYADYEQLVGGVETLFKDSADRVQEYAANAYKTAGLSANQYMETVTSFSASLLQSLGGDTNKAAEVADMAITDMADNANKMGTSIESIQNAYQGFAKQNFTMLDNLKLGYGGTKQEMERLLEDATKLSGVEYDISSLNDIYEAIHVVQTELGITGTTAKEASETISGSLAATKSAWQNLIVGLADGNADMDVLVNNLVESAETAFDNLMPVIEKALVGVADLIEKIAPVLAEKLPNIIEKVAPSLVKAGGQIVIALVKGLIQSIPSLLQAAADMMVDLLEAIGDWEYGIYEKGRDAIVRFGEGIRDAIREAVQWGRDLIDSFVQGIKDRIQHVIDTVKQLAENIRQYIGFSEPELGPLSNFHTYAPDMMDLFAQGIRENAGLVTRAIDGAFDVGAQITDYGVSSAQAGQIVPDSGTAAQNTTAPFLGGEIVFNVTETIDGQVLARNQYRFNLAETARRGPRAIK